MIKMSHLLNKEKEKENIKVNSHAITIIFPKIINTFEEQHHLIDIIVKQNLLNTIPDDTPSTKVENNYSRNQIKKLDIEYVLNKATNRVNTYDFNIQFIQILTQYFQSLEVLEVYTLMLYYQLLLVDKTVSIKEKTKFAIHLIHIKLLRNYSQAEIDTQDIPIRLQNYLNMRNLTLHENKIVAIIDTIVDQLSDNIKYEQSDLFTQDNQLNISQTLESIIDQIIDQIINNIHLNYKDNTLKHTLYTFPLVSYIKKNYVNKSKKEIEIIEEVTKNLVKAIDSNIFNQYLFTNPFLDSHLIKQIDASYELNDQIKLRESSIQLIKYKLCHTHNILITCHNLKSAIAVSLDEIKKLEYNNHIITLNQHKQYLIRVYTMLLTYLNSSFNLEEMYTIIHLASLTQFITEHSHQIVNNHHNTQLVQQAVDDFKLQEYSETEVYSDEIDESYLYESSESEEETKKEIKKEIKQEKTKEKTKKKSKELKEDLPECKICYDSPVESVFQCGHLVCKNCSTKVLETTKTCHMCKTKITTVTSMFY
jgi:hypothetical protein